uniref:uncharacterized protein LOC117155463 isoform X1 n=2 Tax=Bombus vancouverensis nearcticus TaxID=2705178 RepID=UPI00143C6CE3|nr:uncharacterized protein LOC117155463 isoform X1 [Bombus vancouverensis nearcticus]
METLESSRVCRLCGKQSGISINIFDKNENHVKKINAILPIMVHEMDLLPKHMCHRCSYKLEEFHKFYMDCLKTDAGLKNQLSWMRKEDSKESVGVPMVHIENIKIKVEPPDYDLYDDNDYINSMSSVTYPVNSVRSDNIPDPITYTSYARCGCYCDKADQSNQTVPTNYGNEISRCSGINAMRQDNDGRANVSPAVQQGNLSAHRALKERSDLIKLVNEVKDSRRTTFSNFSPSTDKSSSGKKETSKDAIVRNLRPRKGSVDYAGIRKKLSTCSSLNNENGSTIVETKFDVSQIKIEKFDFEGRVLRPRKGTIDYREPIRKYSRSANKNQRSQSDQHGADKTKVRNIASKLKLPLKKMPKQMRNKVKSDIKTEQLSDLEDLVLDGSVSAAMLSLTDEIDALPNSYNVNVRNDRVNCDVRVNRAQHTDNFSIANWNPLRNLSKDKFKSGKVGLHRIGGINYSTRYLRSQDVCLRNGKIRKADSTNVSIKKLRRSFRNFMHRNKTSGKALMKAIGGSVTSKMSAAMKVLDIKHYCDECNTSFANKELFKLHVCYGH